VHIFPLGLWLVLVSLLGRVGRGWCRNGGEALLLEMELVILN
jgi:hypothetical protein